MIDPVRSARKAVCLGLALSGGARLLARANKRKNLVVNYHDVYGGAGDPLLNFDGMHVRIGRFVRQMRYLCRRYRVVSLDQLLDELGSPGSGKPLAAITFDDGYRNTYRYAYPVLKAHGLTATIFPVTEFLLTRRPPWWDRLRVILAETACGTLELHGEGGVEMRHEIRTRAGKREALRAISCRLRALSPARREEALARLAADLGVEDRDGLAWEPLTITELVEMTRNGFSVGAHGLSHDSLLQLSPEALSRELAESKRLLEAWTGRAVSWLAYPHGDFSPDTIAAAVRAGYRGALTTVEGLIDKADSPYALRRIGVDDDVTLAQFAVAISGLRDLLTGLVRRRREAAGVAPPLAGVPAV